MYSIEYIYIFYMFFIRSVMATCDSSFQGRNIVISQYVHKILIKQ